MDETIFQCNTGLQQTVLEKKTSLLIKHVYRKKTIKREFYYLK